MSSRSSVFVACRGGLGRLGGIVGIMTCGTQGVLITT